MPHPPRTSGPVPPDGATRRPARSVSGRPAWAGDDDVVVDTHPPVRPLPLPRSRRFAFTYAVILALAVAAAAALFH